MMNIWEWREETLVCKARGKSFDYKDLHEIAEQMNEIEREFDSRKISHSDAVHAAQQYREALTEIAKKPYKDSDHSSLLEWCNKRASKVLEEVQW